MFQEQAKTRRQHFLIKIENIDFELMVKNLNIDQNGFTFKKIYEYLYPHLDDNVVKAWSDIEIKMIDNCIGILIDFGYIECTGKEVRHA